VTAGSGHTYQVILDNIASWTQARTAATAAGGHLVTITSSSEQQLVEGLIASASPPAEGGIWIGLIEAAEGVYVWDNGEVLSYTN
jgi:hypothetical protein